MLTFLAFVKHWWAGMVLARLVLVGELFAAALMHALLRHLDSRTCVQVKLKGLKEL